MLWKAMQNSGDGYGSSLLSGMVHDSHNYFVGILTVFCLDLTFYCPPGECSSYPHQREVKITTVTPALDEFYRFHRVIGEQIGQLICHTLDSVLILSDVTVADEALNYS
ncbi:hypothetical protein BU17DRAFT_60055 [Hysterangium stoloniferum]|nr:hypothetical protein BU17DRAFT_60055 [Hysterangium stoloniferum]